MTKGDVSEVVILAIGWLLRMIGGGSIIVALAMIYSAALNVWNDEDDRWDKLRNAISFLLISLLFVFILWWTTLPDTRPTQ